MPKVTIQKGQSFTTGEKFTLLDELEAQDLDVDYNCRAGFCGACKTTLHKGEIEQVRDSMYRLKENEILTCCSRAKSDCEISFDKKVNVFQSSYSLTI